ncbi:DNA-binding transcriptional LysR family regulator [Kribbella rubisoli]|jgi:DNA-binding transcriptional LysR family regulator|uniref:DNA-binding transcriptional LysR family regulator n=2 Tax=Kribbella rubisoli TaxID=3075929 RepID=A0A4Q7X9S9_9ACTN|nr:DNA-binding transcriptional LysR family regulator [Kribbella rubisoli]
MVMSDTSPDLDSLMLLTLVAELGSLGQAAERMRISQPAASKRLSMLERRLGLPLAERGTRGSVLTVEGKAVCHWAERVLAEARNLTAGAAALRAERAHDLRLASSMTLAESFLPAWVAELQRQSPGLQLSLKVTNSEQVAALAARHEITIGFFEGPTVPPGLSSRTVATDRLVIVVARTHPWARRRRPVELTELADTPLIVREQGSGTRETLARVFATAGLRPVEPLMVLEVNAAVRRAAAAGIGPAVLSAATVEDDLSLGHLVEINLVGADLHRRLRAVWPKAHPLPQVAEDLLRIARHSR